MRLTDEQQQAVLCDEPRFTIRAAAGSGKTSVLVQRYLRQVIELNRPPDRILTITFTRKAAAEMKKRIVSCLTAEGRPTDAQIAETGPIQTIDSFCERLLRENSIAAGLDPKFKIMGESLGASLKDRAIREAFVELDEGEYPLAYEVFQNRAGTDTYQGEDALISLISDLLGKLRTTGISIDKIRKLHSSPEIWLAEWAGIVAEELGQEAPQGIDAFTVMRNRMVESGQKLPNWLKSSSPQVELEDARATCGLMQIGCLAWEILEEKMARAQEFDFAALEEMAVRLLETNPAIQNRVASQYDAVLVDESQDVNPIQYRLVESLGISNEMMVGDPQQSIYLFRHADRELFIRRAATLPTLNLSRNFRSSPGILAFVDAYFGKEWPDDYVPMSQEEPSDDLFGSTLPAEYDGVEFWSYEANDHHLTAKYIADLVKEMEVRGEKPGDLAVLVYMTASALAISKHLDVFGIPHQIAGGSEQFYTRLEVRDLANALTSLCDSTDRHAWLAFLMSPFVGLSLDSGVLLSQMPDIPGGLAEFIPPVDGDASKLAESLEWISQLRLIADRVPAWELISELLAKTPFMERLATRPGGRQQIANVRKLLQLAVQQPLLGALEFAEKIREIQALRHKEGDAPLADDEDQLLTIMTIHKAKGLEFDNVVLADAFRPFDPKVRSFNFDVHRGIAAFKAGKESGVPHAYLAFKSSMAAREEANRVLYVAMTRAKKRLCIPVSDKPDKGCPAKMVANRFGYPDKLAKGIELRSLAPAPEL